MRTHFPKIYPYLLIALVIVAIYGQTVGFDYSNHDDIELLQQKAGYLGNPGNILRAFTTDVVWGHQDVYYRPLLTLSFMVDSWIGGVRPAAFHLGNVFLHLLAVCLLYAFLRDLGTGQLPSLLASLIFAVHPVLVQAVAWIPGRNDSLLTALVLASFLCYLEYARQGRARWGLGQAGLFLLALLTKETAVLLPLLILFHLWLERRQGDGTSGRRVVMLFVGWAAALAIYLALRSTALSGGLTQGNLRMNTLADNWTGFLSYLGKIFLPVNLSGDPIPADLPPAPGAIGALMLLAVTAALGIRDRSRFLFGAVWFLSFLAPSFAGNTAYANFAEHRLYLPLAGFALMLLQLNPSRFERIPAPAVRMTIGFVLVGLASLTLWYAHTFRSGIAHWERTTRVSPHSYVARTILGRSYANDGRIAEAEREFLAALRLNPRHQTAANDLCLLYLGRGEHRKAEELALECLGRWPDHAGIRNTLGLTYLGAGRPDLAERQFMRSIELGGGAEAADNLGYLYLKQGNLPQAERYLLLAHDAAPGDPTNLYHLAYLYHQLGDSHRAREYYRAAVRNGLKEDPRVLEMLEGR